MVKEGGSLGADLKDVEGRVVVKGLKDLPPGVRHPAKTAQPPLEVGDVVVLVNGDTYENFKDCVAKIRGASDHVTLTVERA
jgi:C-terminal processing protease CtpA/Prc